MRAIAILPLKSMFLSRFSACVSGGTAYAPGTIDAFVECSYLHGVNVFNAASYVYFWSDGSNCSLVQDSTDTRIDRTP